MNNCNDDKCEHNKKQICKLDGISVIDGSCASRRKKPEDDDYKELMRASEPTGHKRGGKWVSN